MENKFTVSSSPHVRSNEDTYYIMKQVVLALVPAALASVYFFRASALYVMFFCILGTVGSEFSFTQDELVVKDEKEIKTFKISYDKRTITLDEFQKEVQMGEKLPNMDSYKNISRYDLYKSTRDLPGYRLYVLNDDTYWMATLYKNNVWRILSMKDSYWNYD